MTRMVRDLRWRGRSVLFIMQERDWARREPELFTILEAIVNGWKNEEDADRGKDVRDMGKVRSQARGKKKASRPSE